MIILNDIQAKLIAEKYWSTTTINTETKKTNREGCYFFSCDRHGGFILSRDALSKEEWDEIKSHNPINGMNANFVALEEDCDWSLAVMICGIEPENMSEENRIAAKKAFDWIDKNRSKALNYLN